MSLEDILWSAFEQVAAHISNLDSIRSLIDDISKHNTTLKDVLISLDEHQADAEVTFQTDIRILLNELKRISKRT